jgi:murein DD-endopeptidase MepM/ murein hydrolase activator NlpD
MPVIHRFLNVYLLKRPSHHAIAMPVFLRNSTLISLTAMAFLILLQASAVADPELPVGSWNPPLETPIRLINQYRQPNSDYSAGHRGVDYLVTPGQPVLAPADGRVWFVGKVAQRSVLSIEHEGGFLTEFEPVCTDLVKGEPVFAGQEIAKVCETSSDYRQHCSSALCLHFSLRSAGKYLSPLVFIGGLNPSRLLPMLEDERFYSRP